MSTDAIGGIGGGSNSYGVDPKNSIRRTLNSVISNMKETGEIARDVFNKLDQFKQEVNKQMDKSTLKKVGEELQQLATQLKNGDIDAKQAEQKVDDLLKMIKGTQVI